MSYCLTTLIVVRGLLFFPRLRFKTLLLLVAHRGSVSPTALYTNGFNGRGFKTQHNNVRLLSYSCLRNCGRK